MKKMYKRYFKKGMLPTGLVVGMFISSLFALAFSYRVLQVSTNTRSVLAISPTNNPTKPTAKPSSNPQPTKKPSSNPQPTSKPSSNPQPTSKPSSNPQPTSKPSSNPQPTNPNQCPASCQCGCDSLKHCNVNCGGGNNTPVPTARPTSSVPANQIPNCFDLKGPTQFRVGETVTFTANFSSMQGQLAGEIFLGDASSGIGQVLKHAQLSGDRGSINDATWTPTTADIGTHTVNCRAWNDGIAECRGGNITLGASNIVRCPGTNCNGATTSLSVEVYAAGAVIPTVTSTPAISQNPGTPTPTPTDPPLPTSVCVPEQISWTKFAGEHIYERSMLPLNNGKYIETVTVKMAPMVNETAPIEISVDGTTWKTFDQKGDRTYSVTLKESQYKQAVTVKVRAKVCGNYSNVLSVDVPALIPSVSTPSATARPNSTSGKVLPAVVVGVAAIAVIGAALYFTGT